MTHQNATRFCGSRTSGPKGDATGIRVTQEARERLRQKDATVSARRVTEISSGSRERGHG